MSHELSAEEYRAMQDDPKRGKYGNRRVVVDGIRFDSQAEASRYFDLKHMERAGLIVNLELQPALPLLVNGVKVGVYKADFRYVDVETDRIVVEDVKGVRTAVYRLKKRMVKAIYGIEIQEIEA